MKGLDHYLTDNSSQEDDDLAYEQAAEALGAAIRACKGSPRDLCELLLDVMGHKGAAEVIEDYLGGDSTKLTDAMIEWNRENN